MAFGRLAFGISRARGIAIGFARNLRWPFFAHMSSAPDLDIDHIARLARLALTPEEKQAYAAQLAEVLQHIRQLQQLDVSNVEPTAHAFPVANVWRDDVPELNRAASVVVSTSTWEGQPLAVQEALQAGAAVVATDVGGTREVTGDAAVLTPPDPGALAAAITGLLTDPDRRERLRVAARARADQLPTPADVLDQLRSVYAGVRR